MKTFYLAANYPKLQEDGTLLCAKRGKLVQSNPEEFVRQAILNYLMNGLEVGKSDIEVEHAMSKLNAASRGRADIFVKSHGKILLLIECKAPEVQLSDDIFYDQALDYAVSASHPEVIWITNGHTHVYYGYDASARVYKKLETLPDIRNPKELVFKYQDLKFNPWVSPTYNQLWDPKFVAQFEGLATFKHDTTWFMGNNPPDARAAIIRLGEWLFFSNPIPKGTKLGPFELTEDLGVFVKSTPVFGFKYVQPHRSLHVRKKESGETFIIDMALIVLNKDREVHLAIRISPKGTGSFTIQPAIDHQIEWRNDRKAFRMFHKASRLTMGKNALGVRIPEYLSQNHPGLLASDEKFYSNWLHIEPNPSKDPQQYLDFMGRWFHYAEAIRLMKQTNKMAKPKDIQTSKKHRIVAEAKKIEQAGKHEEAIKHILNNLNLVGRKKIAIEEAFDMACYYGFWNLAQQSIDAFYKAGTHDYYLIMTWMFLCKDEVGNAWKHVQKIDNPEKDYLYWETKYYKIIEDHQHKESPDSLAAIRKAKALYPEAGYLNLYLASSLLQLGHVREALKVYDAINPLNSFTIRKVINHKLIDQNYHFLLHYGPIEKIPILVDYLLANDPNKQTIWLSWQAEYHLLNGELQEAYDCIQQVLRASETQDDWAQEILYLIQWRQGDAATAYSYFKQIENDPLYTLYLSALSEKLGKHKEAKTYLDQVAQQLKGTEQPHDIFFHATQIVYTFLTGNAKAFQDAHRQAISDMIRLDGVLVYARFIASGFDKLLPFEKAIAQLQT